MTDTNIWDVLGSSAVGAIGSAFARRNNQGLADTTRTLGKEEKDASLGALDESWSSISSWLTPYLDAGTEALGQYKAQAGMAPDAPVFKEFNQGDPFSFDYKDFDKNPAYQFIQNKGLKAVDRLAAKNKQLGSGNRMTAAADYASGLASTEYGNEFNRQKSTYDTNYANRFGAHDYNNTLQQQRFQNQNTQFDKNTGMYKGLMDQGLNTGKALGLFKARDADSRLGVYGDYAASQGAANIVDTNANNALVGDLSKLGGAAVGALSNGLPGVGGATSAPAGVASNALQGAAGLGAGGASGAGVGAMFPGASAGVAGVGAPSGAGLASSFGTGTAMAEGGGASALGVNAANYPGFGGTYAAGTGGTTGGTATGAATAAEAGFGSWAAATAGGFALLAGIKMGVEALRADPKIGKTLEKMAQSKDPLKFIANDIGKGDLVGLVARDTAVIKETGFKRPTTPGGNGPRGMLYSTIIGSMPDVEPLKTRGDIGKIVTDMWGATIGGYRPRERFTGEAVPMPEAGLMKLFPSLAGEIEKLGKTQRQQIDSAGRDYGSENMDNYSIKDGKLQWDKAKDMSKERDLLKAKMDAIMGTWNQSNALQYAAGGASTGRV